MSVVSIDELISRTRISKVVPALGGPKPKDGRCRAWWRGGDNPTSVALDDQQGLWYDHRTGRGGGIIDLIEEAKGCSQHEAAAWLASHHGVTLAGQTQAQALDLKPAKVRAAELAGTPLVDTKPREPVTYRYVSETGALLYEVVRYEPKTFRQRRPFGSGWKWSLGDVRRVLYRLPKVVEADEVFLVEGEKDVHSLEKLGLTATTNSGGASQPWRDEYTAALAGKRVIVIPDNDEPGRKHAAKVAQALTGKAAELIVCELPEGVKDVTDYIAAGHGMDDLRALIETQSRGNEPARAAGDGCGFAYRRISDVTAQPIRWLWPGRIASGKCTVIAGNPGLGKSQLTLAMAAHTTRGTSWPDGTACRPGNVVILSAEDDAADTMRPRLEAAGARLDRVFILDAAVEGYSGDGTVSRRAVSLQTDIANLGRMLDEIGNVALVIIDPVTAYLGGTDSHKNAEVRALLAPLGEMAAAHGVAIVCVSHLNKAGSTDALLRVSGSLAFVAAARAAWLVGKDPDDEARRLFLPLKNNLGADDTGLAFRVEGVTVPSSAGAIETSRIAWQAGVVTTKANELMTGNGDDERGALDEAKDFLAELLSDGPVPAKRVQTEARDTALSWRTINRAKVALGVQSTKGGMGSGWEWHLPRRLPRNTEDCQENAWQPSGDVGNLRGGEVEL